jgi:GT2 family glycosyltransferase
MTPALRERQASVFAQQRKTAIAVIIPTYRRPGPLIDCIRSIVVGSQQPHEIIVIGREGDSQTKEALAQAQKLCSGKTTLRVDWVIETGHVPPVEKGVKLASCEIVAFVDDDVTVTTDWLERLVAPYSDSSVGVVGGRVITPACGPRRLRGKPGRTSWYGRLWANVGSVEGEQPIDVEGVMEGNSAWRRSLLMGVGFDPVLNFDDGCMYGLDLCLGARARGFRVVYNPTALVYHHTAPRDPNLDRADRPRRVFAYCRNYTYIMLKHLPWWRKPIFLCWWFLIGARDGWGLASILAAALTGRPPAPREVLYGFRGKLQGILLSS